jgi:hypothetical protein
MPLSEIAMKTWIFPVAVSIALTGCASTATRPIDAQALGSVRNQSILTTVHEKPSFVATSAANVTFGVIGAVAAVSEGNKIIADNKVEDPAEAISAALADAMQSSQGVQLAGQPLKPDSREAARIAELAKGKARFVLDVQTQNWSFIYFPTDWTHYRVQYVVHARLIDVDARTVVAEAGCKQIPESNANAPTYDQMVAKGAAHLKATLAGYAQACAANIARDMLGLQVPIRTAVAAATPVAAAPAQVPPAQVVAASAAAGPGNWNGVMACEARADKGAHAEAYEARFVVEVQGNTVNLNRRTAEVVESLAGQASADRLELHGTGHRVGEPMRPWRLDISGDFPAGATSFQGKGAMTANGRRLRNCELRMTRV